MENTENNKNLVKSCYKCNESKPYSEFNKQAATKDGYRNICKKCMKKYNEARYNSQDEEEKEEYYQNMLTWRNKHKDKIRKYDEKYRNKGADEEIS